jgi:adenosylcobinamide-phosphate synthase
MFFHPKLLLAALAFDALIGDPDWLYRHLPHPVAAIGRLIGWLDRAFNRERDGEAARRRAGLVVCAFLVVSGAAIGIAIERFLQGFRHGWLIEALIMSAFLAQTSLYRHVAAVARAFRTEGLAGGRRAVSHIVGRDPESLDESGVCRAALESLAENFSDGVVAPAFWALLFGLPGILVYKTINTADSMIGHKSPRHLAFGWASARLDDLLNLAPARIAGLLIVGAAALTPGAKWAASYRAMMGDAARHRSPNAGWQEAPLAGALGVALAGPRRYDGEIVEDHWMNRDGRREAALADLARGLKLYLIACVLQAAVVALIAVI